MNSKAALIFFVMSLSVKGQEVHSDSARKNELSLNILPLAALSAGSSPGERALFSVDYATRLDSKNFFTAGLGLMPFQRFNNFFSPQYHSTVGNRNIFHSYHYSPMTRFFGSLGVEKRHRERRLGHAIGAALIMTYQTINVFSDYSWSLQGDIPNAHMLRGDTTNYRVDSLGYYENHRNKGLGIHLYYSLRLHLTRRFSVLLQTGINSSFIVSERKRHDLRTSTTDNSVHTYIELFTLPSVSRLSLAFRF